MHNFPMNGAVLKSSKFSLWWKIILVSILKRKGKLKLGEASLLPKLQWVQFLCHLSALQFEVVPHLMVPTSLRLYRVISLDSNENFTLVTSVKSKLTHSRTCSCSVTYTVLGVLSTGGMPACHDHLCLDLCLCSLFLLACGKLSVQCKANVCVWLLCVDVMF